MAAIDIGSTASDRTGTADSANTYINKTNPADGDGTITTVEIWADTELADCEVATFSEGAANIMTSRDSEVVNNGNGAGVVLAGSKQTFTVDIDVVTGDYIGIKFSAGLLEYTNGSGDGRWYLGGDQIPCTDAEFTLGANREVSLYGIGATAAAFALEKFNAIVCTKWNELAITKWNALSIP